MNKSFFCNQCGVWKPDQDVTFHTLEEAAKHLVEVHPSRAVAALLTHEQASFCVTDHLYNVNDPKDFVGVK